MTGTSTATGTSTVTAPTTTPQHGVSFGGVIRSEWIKLVTLRSTMWCYLIVIVLTIGLGFLIAGLAGSTAGAGRGAQAAVPVQPQQLWVQVATIGIGFAQLVSAVLGALVITGEYGTGMIRSTFAAVPTRLPAIVAKALVFGVVTFVVSLVSIIATALLTAPLLSARGFAPDLGDGQAWWSMIGGAGYIVLIGLLSFSIGTLIRNSAGGIATSLGLILVVPTIVQVFAGLTKIDWVQNLGTFLPSTAGAVMHSYPSTAAAAATDLIVLTPVEGFLVLAAWIVVLFGVAATLVSRRDA